jgi:hypothetical protein
MSALKSESMNDEIEERACHHGATSRVEHTAIRLGESRLPRKAQPVPPIFQPEVAAEAIYFAAHRPRREFYVGWPSAKAIIASKIVPGLLDHFLAHTGYNSQQYDGAEDRNRPHNLWEPLPGDHGAHGDFDARAKSWSAQWWTSQRRGVIGVVIAGTVLAAAIVFFTSTKIDN